MTVWVLLAYDEYVGVFSSEEAAKKYAEDNYNLSVDYEIFEEDVQ